MNIALTLLGIGINLAGIGLQVTQFQNIWLSFVCMFVGGGCVFLGLFGKRSADLPKQSLYDKLGRDGYGVFIAFGSLAAFILILILCSIGYSIINREMDIQAAKAGLATPSTIPTPVASPEPSG